MKQNLWTDFDKQLLVYLCSIPGFGARDIGKLIQTADSIQDILSFGFKQWRPTNISETKITRAMSFIQKNTVDSVLDNLSKYDIKFITIFDHQYPQLLKQITSPPYVLFYKGSVLALNQTIISIVGTRKPTQYGIQMTKTFTSDLIIGGLSIGSGLAFGIDTIAHTQTVADQGIGVAVLAHGLDTVQPTTNLHLAKQLILNGGALVSEYPPGTPALRQHFPARNRIVAGLAVATLVIEGAQSSGSLITAQFAHKYQRLVFAMPGLVQSPMSAGPHWLIRNGMTLVRSAEDVLEALEIGSSKSSQVKSAVPTSFESSIHEQVYQALKSQPQTRDDLSRLLGIPVAELNQVLTDFELDYDLKVGSDGKLIL